MAQMEDLIDEMKVLKEAYNEQVALNSKLQMLNRQSSNDRELQIEQAVNKDLRLQLQYILGDKGVSEIGKVIGYSDVVGLQEKNEQLLRAQRYLTLDLQTLVGQPDKICALSNQVAELQALLQKSGIAKQLLKEQITVLEQQQKQIKQQYSQSQSQLADQQALFQNAKQTVATLEDCVHELEEENSSLLLEKQALQSKCNTHEDNVEKIRAECQLKLTDGAQETARLQNNNEELKIQVSQLQIELHKTKQQFIQAETQSKSHQLQLETTIEASQKNVQDLQHQIELLTQEKQKLLQSSASSVNLNEQYMNAMQQLEDSQQQISSLSQKNEQMQVQVQHLKVLESDKSRLEQEVLHLRQQVESSKRLYEQSLQASKDAKAQLSKMMVNVRSLEREKSDLLLQGKSNVLISKAVEDTGDVMSKDQPEAFGMPISQVEVSIQQKTEAVALQGVDVKSLEPRMIKSSSHAVVPKSEAQTNPEVKASDKVLDCKTQDDAKLVTLGHSAFSMAPSAIPLGFGFGSAYKSASDAKSDVSVEVRKRELEGSESPVSKRPRDSFPSPVLGTRKDSTESFINHILADEGQETQVLKTGNAKVQSSDEEGEFQSNVQEVVPQQLDPVPVVEDEQASTQSTGPIEVKDNIIRTSTGRVIKKISFDDAPASPKLNSKRPIKKGKK